MAWSTGFGLTPTLLTGALTIHGALVPEPWLIAADGITALVGAGFGLLSCVVATRIERTSGTESTLVQGMTDAARLALVRASPLQADEALEMEFVQVPGGFKSTIRRIPGQHGSAGARSS